MDFLELAQQRYSVRKYSDKPIEEEKLQKILEAGRIAPTAVNAQPQRIFILRTPEMLERIRNATKMAFNAPVVLLVCYDKALSWKANAFSDPHDSGEMDASIVTCHMMMEATELGIGSLWVRGYNQVDVAKAMDIPKELQLCCILDLGYPADDDKPAGKHYQRFPLSETVFEMQ